MKNAKRRQRGFGGNDELIVGTLVVMVFFIVAIPIVSAELRRGASPGRAVTVGVAVPLVVFVVIPYGLALVTAGIARLARRGEETYLETVQEHGCSLAGWVFGLLLSAGLLLILYQSLLRPLWKWLHG